MIGVRRLIVLALVTCLGLAACDTPPSPAPSPTDVPVPTPTTTAYTLNTTVWYAGLQLTFGTATAILDQYGGTLAVDTRFTNPGTDDQQMTAPIQIVAGASRFDPQHGTVLPDIPAGGTSDITLTFDIVGTSNLDAASIVVGTAEGNQPIVPLRLGGTAKAITLKPRTIKVKGTATISDFQLTLRTGQLRWDLPDWADEEARGMAALTLTYDARYLGTFIGGLAFTGANVSLLLPDGSTVGPRRDGHSQSIAQLLPGHGQTGLSSRFEIPSGETGRYMLLVRNGGQTVGLRFTISG